jgi:hypothetical protein
VAGATSPHEEPRRDQHHADDRRFGEMVLEGGEVVPEEPAERRVAGRGHDRPRRVRGEEPSKRHARHAGDHRHEDADEADEPAQEDGDESAPLEEPARPVELLLVDPHLRAEALDQPHPAARTDRVARHAADHPTGRAADGDPPDRQLAARRERGRRHEDRLGGHGNAAPLRDHRDRDEE